MRSNEDLVAEFSRRMQGLMNDPHLPWRKQIEAENCVREIEHVGTPPCLLELHNQFAACATVIEQLASIVREHQRSRTIHYRRALRR